MRDPHSQTPPRTAESGVVCDASEAFAAQMSDSRRVVKALEANRERGAALLFDTYSKMVNGLVWRLLGADPDHDDVVQQVFCSVLSSMERLRDPDKLGAWVRRITVNTVYGELRKREVRRLFLLKQPPASEVYVQTQDVETRDLLSRARQVMDKLPARERMVFLLHHVEGYTLNEVAELQGYSLATAKRRLSAADKRFQKLVQQNPDLVERLAHRRRSA